MSDTSRRGFLARIGLLATAPVLTAFLDDETTGLMVPDRQLEIASEAPPPLLISSSAGVMPIVAGTSMSDDVWPHSRLHRGDGTLVFVVNGEQWVVPAFRVGPHGQGQVRG